jgi:thioredoxin 1
MNGTLHLTERTFDEALMANPGLAMLDFWAPWCGPCRAIAPVLEELAKASAGQENPGLAARYGTRSIPTILFVKDSVVMAQ